MIALERRGGRPLVIAHRGGAALGPENTLRCFRAAVEARADLVEFDVLRLRDGELVLAHSHDLREVSHGAARGSLRRMTLAEACAFCPELPRLEEALAFFSEEAPEVGLHVDLKTPRAAGDVARALRRFRLAGRSLVSCAHPGALRAIADAEKEICTGVAFPRDRLSLHRRRGADLLVRGGLRALRVVATQAARALLARSGASAIILHHALVTPALVERAHAAGVAVVAWTVDDPADLARVEEAGVDAVVTDDPARLVSRLDAMRLGAR
ncbi:MAG TPA: glycerophosphodiester phosphodiesterase [Gaiellaceae bacterium]|nr:glycerophosphodiester phosphodiesterase [Gaiellaceae bacterium]